MTSDLHQLLAEYTDLDVLLGERAAQARLQLVPRILATLAFDQANRKRQKLVLDDLLERCERGAFAAMAKSSAKSDLGKTAIAAMRIALGLGELEVADRILATCRDAAQREAAESPASALVLARFEARHYDAKAALTLLEPLADREGLRLAARLALLAGETSLFEAKVAALTAQGEDVVALEARASLTNGGDVAPLVDFLRNKASAQAPVERLLGYLRLIALGADEALTLIQTPRNVHRQHMTEAANGFQAMLLCELAEGIERVQQEASDVAQIPVLMKIVDRAARLEDLEAHFLILAAAAALVERRKFSCRTITVASRSAVHRLRLPSAQDAADVLHPLGFVKDHIIKKPKGSSGLGPALEISARLASFKLKTLLQTKAQADEARRATIKACVDIVIATGQSGHGVVQKLMQLGSCMDWLVPEDIRVNMLTVDTPRRSTGMPTVRKIITEDLGRSPDDLYQSFETTPYWCGSIGQVHRARLRDGSPVVVKVQYPGIASQLKSSFNIAKSMSWIFTSAFPGCDLKGLLDAWVDLYLRECDYHAEVRHQTQIRALFENDPDVVVPRVYPELCSSRVITQELVQGERLSSFAINATQAERNRLGVQLVRTLFLMSTVDLFNVDIHPGNFLVHEGRLVLLDFGAVLRVSETNGRRLELIDALRRNDIERFVSLLEAGSFYTPKLRQDPRPIVALYRNLYMRPFLEDKPFKFTTDFARSVLRTQYEIENKQGYTILPASSSLTNVRFYWSLYSLLAMLEAEADWGQLATDTIPLLGAA